MKKLGSCDNAKAVAALYSEYGVEVNAEDLEAALTSALENTNGELSEDKLEEVSGGCFISGGAFLAWCIVYSAVELQAAWVLGRASRR